jgi:response regulator RpfG family c-di-GMP phosphodiesterase
MTTLALPAGPSGELANGPERPRVLCVDDEPNILASLRRSLRLHYDVVTASSASEALTRIAQEPPFAVVVSDLRMPGTDGIVFLGCVRQRAPDTVRVLLTGQAELDGAIAAVNEGQVFRFLVKPCDQSALLGALRAAVGQYRLITAERVLLERTVHGSITALTDLLAIVQPASFGRGTRLKRLVEALAADLDVPERWQVEVAALLSQVGYIVVPPEIAERLRAGRPLNRAERDLGASLPRLAEQLIESIPRLEGVREILRHQQAGYAPESGVPIGARLLRVANDFDVLETQGMTPGTALDALEGRRDAYDPAVLAAMRRVCGLVKRLAVVQELRLADVQIGMIFATDVASPNGLLLVARGQEVTTGLRERITNFWDGFATSLRVQMIVPPSPETARAGAPRSAPAPSSPPVA